MEIDNLRVKDRQERFPPLGWRRAAQRFVRLSRAVSISPQGVVLCILTLLLPSSSFGKKKALVRKELSENFQIFSEIFRKNSEIF